MTVAEGAGRQVSCAKPNSVVKMVMVPDQMCAIMPVLIVSLPSMKSTDEAWYEDMTMQYVFNSHGYRIEGAGPCSIN